jgi:hypothetical protein
MPDARAGAMADAGVALAPDVNSISINSSKLPFLKQRFGVSASYSPWLKSLIPDMNLGYISAYLKPDPQTAVAVSMRYFSLGNVQYTSIDQQDLGRYKPAQMAIDAAYSRKLTDNLSVGTAFRYVRTSNDDFLAETSGNNQSIQAIAADVSAYYVQPTILFGFNATISGGLNLSNIARPIRQKDDPTKYYLPTNLKLGTAVNLDLDEDNQFRIAVDLNKLLIPLLYKNPSSGVVETLPTDNFKQVSIGAGLEYVYRRQFAIRGGYLHEDPKVGERRYLTCGAGFCFDRFNLDVSYLAANIQKSPLANTLRFTLMFTFGPD